jgi:hypothetical protein
MSATINYKSPVSGTTPPTAVQMLPLSRVVAQVVLGDSDTTALITHNMNIPLASTPAQHGQNSYNPMVVIAFDASSAGTLVSPITITRGTNTITLTKTATTAGTNATLEVHIERYEPIL